MNDGSFGENCDEARGWQRLGSYKCLCKISNGKYSHETMLMCVCELRLYGVGHEVKDHLEQTRCCHCMDYSFRLAARDLLHAQTHR